MSWTHRHTDYNHRSLISPLFSPRATFSNLALWCHYWPVTTYNHEVLVLWRHIHRLFLHAQLGAKLIFTNEQQPWILLFPIRYSRRSVWEIRIYVQWEYVGEYWRATSMKPRHICVSKLGHHWSRLWFGKASIYLNQRWYIVNWKVVDEFKCNCKHSKAFSHKSLFENDKICSNFRPFGIFLNDLTWERQMSTMVVGLSGKSSRLWRKSIKVADARKP